MSRLSALARSLAYATNRPSGEISPFVVKPESQVRRLNVPGIAKAGGFSTLTSRYKVIAMGTATNSQIHRGYEGRFNFNSAGGNWASIAEAGGAICSAGAQ